MSPWLEHILAHALPLGVRLAGVMTFAPFFGSDAFPARVKAALVLALTALLYGVCRTPEVALTIFSMTRLVLKEAVIGLLMGLSVQIVLEGAQLAGQLAGAQLGFSLAAIIDPQTNIETPVLAIFYQMIALLIFLQLNVHHWILRAVVKSFTYFPVGTSRPHPGRGAGTAARRRGHVADRGADRRAHLAGHPGNRRDRRFSEQGLAAAAGHAPGHLREKPGGLRPAGGLRGAVAAAARTPLPERRGLDGGVLGVAR